MRLYHGSNCKIKEINLEFSRKYKDFGAGFYLTPDYGRAVNMANRCVDLEHTGSAEMNPFIFNRRSCPKDIRIKEFRGYDWEWAEFIMKNRDRTYDPPYSHGYDIVIGPVADSRVDPIISEYKLEFGEGYADPENLKVLASRLVYPGSLYIQYCFCTLKGLQFLYRD